MSNTTLDVDEQTIATSEEMRKVSRVRLPRPLESAGGKAVLIFLTAAVTVPVTYSEPAQELNKSGASSLFQLSHEVQQKRVTLAEARKMALAAIRKSKADLLADKQQEVSRNLAALQN
jgi:hypothetical protein